MDKIVEKREREAGACRSKYDAIRKLRTLKHRPVDGQVPSTAFNIAICEEGHTGVYSLR